MPKELTLNNSLIKHIAVAIAIVALLTACDFTSSLNPLEEDTKNKVTEVPTLTLAVSPYVGWMPWLLAEEEGIYKTHISDYQVDVQIVLDDYEQTIEKFISGKVQAIAITNIDAIARLIREDIKADVILITSYSNGHDAILLKAGADLDIRDETLALLEHSSRHYLLDRYLMRKQITFDEVNVHNIKKETNILEIFDNDSIYGVVTVNPYKEMLIQEEKAHLLFDSRQIPKEIMDFIIIRRDILLEYPNFAQALLATWFLVMERLQGNNRTATIDSMAKLMNVSRDEYTSQIQEIILNDTPTKALSAIRDRSMQKTMRFIKHFAERYGLTGDEPYDRWVSYPGRAPELIHFNARPLQDFIAPPRD